MRTRVKICGLTRSRDVLLAARLGVDAIGLVFYPRSPRAVTVEGALVAIRGLPPFVTLVGLFVDPDDDEVRRVLDRVPLDLLQFHGDEPPEACGGFGRPWIKAIRMREGVDLHAERRRYADAAGLLVDTYQPGVPGGTGRSFDWDLLPSDLAGEIILAGGLTPESVSAAVRRLRPYAVDVSGGVELAKGVKDPAKMAAFMHEVRHGDTH